MINNKYYTWENSSKYKITTDPEKIDKNKLYYYLSQEAYWSMNIPREIVLKSLEHSLNFSMISSTNEFIGFARVVTDYYTFGWLADVFIDKSYRKKGLGKWLIKTIVNHPELQSLRNFLLFTKDAHGLYHKYGWKPLDNPEILLAIKKSPTDLYKRQ